MYLSFHVMVFEIEVYFAFVAAFIFLFLLFLLQYIIYC